MEHPTQPLLFSHNPFSILGTLSTDPSASSEASPPQLPRPKLTPQQNITKPILRLNIKKLIRISETFSTTSARVLSFQEWPHVNITPQQLARVGFYHQPYDEELDNVCCFACGSEVSRLDPVGLFTTRELAEWHEGDYL